MGRTGWGGERTSGGNLPALGTRGEGAAFAGAEAATGHGASRPRLAAASAAGNFPRA
jgi:hypothetical protein